MRSGLGEFYNFTAGDNSGLSREMRLATRAIFAHLWQSQRGYGALGEATWPHPGHTNVLLDRGDIGRKSPPRTQ